jgi:hypothetical protein
MKWISCDAFQPLAYGMKSSLAFLLSIILFASCSEENNSANDLTVEYFREYLRKDMSSWDLIIWIKTKPFWKR